MYQFYYADESLMVNRGICKENVRDKFNITAIRPTMWEEHCLECSAPVCFNNCLHYLSRSDGRCKRFENGLKTFEDEKACCGQGTHVKFRKWANMMTIIFPAMLPLDDYAALCDKNEKLGKKLKSIESSKLPRKFRWESIRTIEFMRRRKLRGLSGIDNEADAFIFHGYSYNEESYRLIIEVYNDHTSVYKTSLSINQGENLYIINRNELSPECWKADNLVKVYPENDFEAELDILWCDFVKGEAIVSEMPAATVKCVVWDLDNTLWDGTLIETDNTDELKIKDGVLETIKQLDERGIIQSVASKNDHDAAWEIVEKLGVSEYFLYPQIHWNAKSGSIEQIAKSLNIGIDSLALIDDSVFEREQVNSVWKQVRTYDALEIDNLLDYPEFKVMVTEESKKRRAMYQAEEKRNELKVSGNNDTIEFLKKCHLKIKLFVPKSDTEIMRCYELVVRTNQLNMSGKKYTKEEFNEILNRTGHMNFAFSCADDFGEYGIVGFGQYRVEDKKLIFTEFAMSCRVAGKYVESGLFTELLCTEKCSNGVFVVNKTKKNVLLRKTLEEIGFVVKIDSTEQVVYNFDCNLINNTIIWSDNFLTRGE